MLLPEHVALPWVRTIPGVPYFQTEDGHPWHPIGQNDAISWPELSPLYRRRDPAAVDDYLAWQAAHGVTCMRLMLEYAQHRHRYLESAPGRWAPNMVRFWDDLFPLCERHNIRLLLTPYDTFWMWLRFHHHPYNRARGGPLRHPSRALLSRATRDAIKARLTFAAQRWGSSGALFAWDLWNEIHPAHAENSTDPFYDFIDDLSQHLRAVEQAAFGRTHPQTVSLFGPELQPHSPDELAHAIFRHPALDFATIHIYQTGTIDHPRNTVDAAQGMGNIVRDSIAATADQRPFLDTEHGPIHSFKDRRITLPETFDDEYFRHLQWAHLASGGAGGGMRWPNRHPHTLTAGMRLEQRSLSRFLPLIDWLRFDRHNLSDQVELTGPRGKLVSPRQVLRFACASPDQALLYLLRRGPRLPDRRLDPEASPLTLTLHLPQLKPGDYCLTTWNTAEGRQLDQTIQPGPRFTLPPIRTDAAYAITRA